MFFREQQLGLLPDLCARTDGIPWILVAGCPGACEKLSAEVCCGDLVSIAEKECRCKMRFTLFRRRVECVS